MPPTTSSRSGYKPTPVNKSPHAATAAPTDRMVEERVRIHELQLRSLTPVPFARPFYDATMGPFHQYQLTMLRLVDADGNWGECEFPPSQRYVLDHIFRPLLLASETLSYRELYHQLFWAIRNEGFRGGAALALGHLDRIFCDLFSRRAGQPAYRYLGGDTASVPVYASGGGTTLRDQDLLDELLGWQEAGYRTLKMKFGGVGTTVADHVKRIATVREALDPATELAVDANQSLTLPEAQQLSRALESLDIAWLEEPLHSADLRKIRALCDHTSLAVSYGESERTDLVFPSLIEAGVAHLQPIAGHISGLHAYYRVARMATAAGLRFSSGGTSFLNAGLVAACGPTAQLEFLAPVVGAIRPLLATYPEERDGRFLLADEPGLGVTVDWPLLQRGGRITSEQVWKR